ncbi:bifunctional DNA-formamidopyrimidine glycosylase/DNA-(apurinic or apyrimidinic site) lyase [Pleomorphochaeta sp. DL1XJH-081]|jgi:formamidopyrimidine-DNA glycosylase|uniref:bifunctional DNA-formamidopyrimidine glycosylase/DNA-(apurinic or apyrimidinic site) lyase n=1 Tax=Pleomorphochaeta sp. DL1XJH-081 TaxID=3409690 RepID=UPI003BB7CAD8
MSGVIGMPELPEVETTCRDILNSPIMGQTITSTAVRWQRSIGEMATNEFVRRLAGRRFVDVSRRGKFIHLKLDDRQSLLVHLRMSGSLEVKLSDTSPDVHDRVIITFETHGLAFHDPRKFGRMILTDSPGKILDRLGPEPFDIALSNGGLYHVLQKKRANIKSVLLDQQTIAGIGNIYADESLFLSRIHPLRKACELTPEETQLLLQSIRSSLLQGIESRGTSLGNGEANFSSFGHSGENKTNLLVFQRTGKPCPVCNSPIEKIIVSQRSTHLCPHCQRDHNGNT